MVISLKERVNNMQKRGLSIIAFLIVVGASFYLGTFVNQAPTTVDSNPVFSEIMEQLMNNHYTQPNKDDLWQGAIDGMLDSVNDPYTSYFDYDEFVSYQNGFGEDYVGIGVTVQYHDERIVVEEVKPNSPADNAGILPNDIIVEVDGEDITDLPFYDAIQNVIGEENTEVSVGVVRSGFDNIITFTMTREVIENSTVYYTHYLEGTKTIGYIKVTKFGDETATLFEEAITALETLGIDGLVIDMRNNPGGHLYTVIDMLQQLLVDDQREMFSIEYYSNSQFIRDEFYGKLDEKKTYEIVTLINGNSASAAEVFASAMKEHGEYPVVGTTSFGKGTMQTDVKLQQDDEDLIHLTIGKWITANGNWVHFDGGTNGVVPTNESKLTRIELAYKLFMANDEKLVYDTVDPRTENLQIILNEMGYTVRTDGYFDQATKDAIIDIQTTNSLSLTGDVDSEVLVYINQFLDTFKDDYKNDTQLATAIDLFNE